MSNYFAYIRDFFTVDGINFGELNFIERLVASAFLTKFRYDDKRSVAEILFGYDPDWKYALIKDFKAYDAAITDIIQNEHGYILDYIKKNAKELAEKSDRIAESKWKIRSINIDIKLIFTTRCGDGHIRGGGTGAKSGLSQIAFRAFVLAASSSSLAAPIFRMIPTAAWLGHDAGTNITRVKKSIADWAKTVCVSGEFEGKFFIVDPKDKQLKGGSVIRSKNKIL